MNIIKQLLQDIPIPKMVKIRQHFNDYHIGNISEVLIKELNKPEILNTLKPGMKIAVAVGSRGIANIDKIVAEAITKLKKSGTYPFIVPSMGSHGGATAAGQKEVLAELGITEKTAGCPIISSMEVVELGRLPNGLPVYMDKIASQADGIIVINRIKPHTAFRGPSESGLVKMITIGLGKQKGAESCHAYGFKYMAEHIVAMAKIALQKAPILFGIGVIENAYDQTAKIVAVPGREILDTDRKLQVEAKANMPRIYFSKFDVLIVDQIGKDISGDGMDPNITGRYPSPYASGGPEINKIVVRDLTVRTNGNANGMGTADFTTRKLVNKIDYLATYANGLTSTVVQPTHTPTVLDCDLDAIKAAIKTCNAPDISQARVVRIKNTLALGEIYISEAMLKEASVHPNIEVLSQPFNLLFDQNGEIID